MIPHDDSPYRIPTYKKVWKIERQFFKIGNIKLPRPVTLWQIFYFFVGFVIVLIIDLNTPFLKFLTELVRYGLLPAGISYYLSRIKHDGKKPHRWLYSYLRYILLPKRYARYKRSHRSGRVRYYGTCCFREHYVVRK